MSYAKYTEDNNKIRHDRQDNYLLYQEVPPRYEEYIPYTIRYKIHQPKQVRKDKSKHVICS